MRLELHKYILIPVIILGFLFFSCDKDDNSYSKEIEGHWVYSETKAEVYVTDPALKEKIEEYIVNRNDIYNISFEFKNDKTYYYYHSYAEPLKGIYKVMEKNMFCMDDSEGLKTVIQEDSVIYIVSDLKKEIIEVLGIDEKKIIKVGATDTFTRGLYVD